MTPTATADFSVIVNLDNGTGRIRAFISRV